MQPSLQMLLEPRYSLARAKLDSKTQKFSAHSKG
jgi:hypothetical protein